MRRTTRSDGTALLLEVSGSHGVALTPDGQFVRVRVAPGVLPGEEVPLGTDGRSVARAGGRRRPGPAFVLAAAAVVCAFLLGPLAVLQVLASGPAVAYVSVDINPSLEFGVNRFERVVGAQALNPEGEELLSRLPWRGRSLDAVVTDAGLLAYDLGYFRGGQGEVLLAAAPAAEGSPVPPGVEAALERLRSRLAARLQERLGPGDPGGLTVETVLADAFRLREEAGRLGLSVGRYAALLAAQEAGLELGPDDIGKGIGKAIREAGGHPGTLLGEAHRIQELSRLAEKFAEKNGLGTPGGHGSGSDAGPEAGPGASGNKGTSEQGSDKKGDTAPDKAPPEGTGSGGHGPGRTGGKGKPGGR
ncbi:MAG: anti-sigma factor domain-containing protein [Firmicutes bacterium]|nr:anti-sigma factor domain-containing protein [Bacillota bacterium]